MKPQLLGAALVISLATVSCSPVLGQREYMAVSKTPSPFTALTGTVSTFAGSTAAASVNGTGTAASFNFPRGVTTDGTNVYVGETAGNLIRKIVIATRVVTTLAGSGTAGSDDGTGTAASFNGPNGVATDGVNVYVADANNNLIRKVVIATGVVTTLAGSGTAGSDDGTGTAASFSIPSGVATDGVNVYVADQGSNTIRQIVIATRVVTTLAGTAGSTGSADDVGAAASFGTLTGLATDGTNVYVADFGNNKIRQIVIATGAVTTLAGSGAGGSDNDIGTAATFSQPDGVATDGTYVYVADTSNNIIRQIVIATGAVTTLAGSGGLGTDDGVGTAASFNNPYQVAVSSNDP